MDTLSLRTAAPGDSKLLSEYERYVRERATIFATAVPPDEDDDELDDEDDEDDTAIDDDEEDGEDAGDEGEEP